MFRDVEAWWNTRSLITASYKVFNDGEFLPFSLASVYPYVDHIDIVEGAVRHRRDQANDDGSSTDNTLQTIAEFPDPDNKIRLVTGVWESKEEIQKKLLEMCSSKWMLYIDADEVIDYSSMSVVKRWCFENQDGKMTYARPQQFFNLYHDFHHVAYSINAMSPWYEFGLPHPFLIWRDIPGLNFAQFHTLPADGFGNFIGRDSPVYRGREHVLDDVFVIHLGNAKDEQSMRDKLAFEIRRGVGIQIANPEDDHWFTGVMPKDMVIADFPGPWPSVLDNHPRKSKISIEVTQKKPHFEFKTVDRTIEEEIKLRQEKAKNKT